MGQAKLFKQLRRAVGWTHIPQGKRQYADPSNTGALLGADKSRAQYKDLKDHNLALRRRQPLRKTLERCPNSGMLLTLREKRRRRKFVDVGLLKQELFDKESHGYST